MTDSSLTTWYQNLQWLVDTDKVPLLCVGIYEDDKWRVRAFSCNSADLPGSTNPPSSTILTPDSLAGNPRVKISEDGFESAGQMVFAVGSLGKEFLATTFAILIHPKEGEQAKIHNDLTWEARLYETWNKVRARNRKPRIPVPGYDPTIREALCHVGLPALTSFIQAYNGKFLLTEDDFIKYAAKIAKEVRGDDDGRTSEYSTCNSIALILLLKELEKSSIHAILKKYIFEPFGFERTTIVKKDVEDWLDENIVVQGQRLLANPSRMVEVDKFQYLNTELESFVFGCRSCIDDLGKLLKGILKAHSGEQNQPLSKDAAAELMKSPDFEKVLYSPIGQQGYLDSDITEKESLNAITLFQKRTLPSLRLGTLNGKRVPAYKKGGVLDGFTSSLYFVPTRRRFVVAFANVTSLLDYADYACQMILEDILILAPYGSFRQQIDDVERPIARSFFANLSQEQIMPDISENLDEFVGRYEHTISHHIIEITRQGELHQRPDNDEKVTVKVRVVNGKLRVFATSLESWADFRSVKYRLDESLTRRHVYLTCGPGQSFRRLKSSGP